MRPPVFVKLNATEGLGGGAFTFSIFSSLFFLFIFYYPIDKRKVLFYNPESRIMRARYAENSFKGTFFTKIVLGVLDFLHARMLIIRAC